MEGIVKELLTDTYYFNRMSMFLRESYGIKDRIKVLAKIIERLDKVYEKIIGELNVFDENYSTNYGVDISKTNKYLDRVGNIFGLKRSFTIKYGTNDNPSDSTDLVNGLTKYITLNNKEFLQYIKLQIIKQNFAGTREELAELYGDDNVSNTSGLLSGLNFIYFTDEDNPVTVDIYWQTKNENYSTDFKYMFLNGLLTIESMGIKYNKVILNIDSIAVFNKNSLFMESENDETISIENRKVFG